ncbi:MAG TPA: hypothetical protein GXZ93_03850 [Actinobacteria bacterium]|jgi:hypothetical protein|nr:hypothetical protein [Actinomycetota bacterium]
MIDFQNFKKAQYMTKRMTILKESCELNGLNINYLFGLFNYYNQKNRGRWFWQKAVFTGAIKEKYDSVNSQADELVKSLKDIDESTFNDRVKIISSLLNDLMIKMEENLGIDRSIDRNKVEGFLDANMSALIRDSLGTV